MVKPLPGCGFGAGDRQDIAFNLEVRCRCLGGPLTLRSRDPHCDRSSADIPAAARIAAGSLVSPRTAGERTSSAGLVLTTLLVPQRVACAQLAGCRKSPARVHVHHVPGGVRGVRAVAHPGAGPGLLAGSEIAATITPFVAANGDPEWAIAMGTMLRILVAAIILWRRPPNLGFIADLLSKPTMIG